MTEPVTERTEAEQRRLANLKPFQPGQSGNPAGRPKGARQKLTEAFINALHADFEEHGEAVVRAVRSERPSDYLRTVAALMPKQVEGSDDPDSPPVKTSMTVTFVKRRG